MLKLLSSILFLFYCCFSFSQIKYNFDYLLEYKSYVDNDSTNVKMVYYYTNSNDNSFFARIIDKDSLNFNLTFASRDKLFASVTLNKKESQKAQIISINCLDVFHSQNQYKYQVNNYDIVKIPDTIKSTDVFKIYSLKSKKYQKRKKINSLELTFDLNSIKHKPLLIHPTVYEEWKSNPNLPNNLVIEEKYYNYEDNLTHKSVLTNYYKIQKTIEIKTEDCRDSFIEEISN